MKPIANKLIEWLHDEAQSTTERILYINQSGDIATIDVKSKTAIPLWRTYDEITVALDTGNAILAEKDDFAPPPLSESELNTPEYQKIKEGRDRAYERIAPLVNDENEVLILFPHERARIIAQRGGATG